MKKTDESKNEQITEKSEKQQKMFFGKEKLNKESDQNGRCKKKDKKIEIEKRKKRKRKKQNKKEDTHNIFNKCDIFQKSKDVKKRRRYRN